MENVCVMQYSTYSAIIRKLEHRFIVSDEEAVAALDILAKRKLR